MKKIIYSFVLIVSVSLLFSSCGEDYLDTYPTDNISSNGVTSSTNTAWTALNGIHRALYERYGSQGRVGLGAYYLHIDEMGEDMVFNYATWSTYLRWQNMDATSSDNRDTWLMFYGWISNANILINGIDNAAGEQTDKDAIKGQALLYRAFCHYELVQMYGSRYVPEGNNMQLSIPIMVENTTDGLARNSVEDVYNQINTDIDKAIDLLNGYSRTNKSHLNQDVAYGLKARVALTMGEYETAASYAKLAQQNYTLMEAETYAKGFQINSEAEDEFMWASHIIEDQTDKWGNYGAYVSRNFSSTSIRKNPRSINSTLYNMISDTDVRKTLWDPTGNHTNLPEGVEIVSSAKRYPYTNQKFIAVSTSDSRVDVPHMRISEMYLIEAEAKARLNDNTGAAQALYEIAKIRDASYELSTNTGEALIEEILTQRRVELWGEGFRFYDLKRLNLPLDRTGANHNSSVVNNLLEVAAGTSKWVSYIPQDEIDANPKMEQNK
ncbi:RagB/SusD family nutrient uptake outer membrane protein [Labilibaculum euxinus]